MEQKEPIKAKPVIKGKVREQSPSITKRVASSFIQDDAKSIGEYVIFDVLLPALKDTMYEMVSRSLSMALFGTDKGTKKTGNTPYYTYAGTTYNGQSRGSTDVYSRPNGLTDDIIFEDREDAERVLDSLIDHLDQYRIIAVSDYYQMIGKPDTPQMNHFGWTDIKSARVSRVHGGYKIDLPKPKRID